MSNDILKTYVFFVVDNSGSMKGVKEETILSINEQINYLKKSQTKKMKAFASLSVYNEEVKHIFLNKNVFDIKSIDDFDLKPEGMTATYDAIGSVIEEAEKIKDDDNTSYLFIVLSDGNENSSKKYSKMDVASKISKLQSTGRWTFAYIGANQDLDLVSKNLNIPKGNILEYVSSNFGFNDMSSRQIKYLVSYFIARSYGTKSTRGFYGSDL